MQTQIIEISDPAELDALGVLGSLTRPVRGEIILTLAGLDAWEQREWQRRLTRKVFACGCGTGAVLGLGGLVSFAAWRLAGLASFSDLTWVDLTLAIIIFVAGTGIGKALGLAVAGVTLRRLTLRLRTVVTSRTRGREV